MTHPDLLDLSDADEAITTTRNTVVAAANEPRQMMHVSTGSSSNTLVFDRRTMPIRFRQLARLMDHFGTPPEDRARLGTLRGAQLVPGILTVP
ncbi:MAG: hypothetical protein ACTTI9_07815 [Schaalia odontolytica]